MNLNEITEISRLMAKYGITEFNAESEGHKIKMKREVNVIQGAPAMMPEAVIAAPAAAAAPVAEEAAAPVGEAIESPIVGTFYTASAPDQPSFVKVGDTVGEDTVVCIVEAMKVMNEIKAGKSGTITEILLEAGTPVEFGQPLFRIS